ncbi:MAG: YcaO-like family protein [Desulfovibrio sp.]|nr:YcaO-like family protein [Desulfovibrio sp.]
MLLSYSYTHKKTQAGTGYYTACPDAQYSFEELVEESAERPNDTFLHRHLLQTVLAMPPAQLRSLCEKENRPFQPLLYEACQLRGCTDLLPHCSKECLRLSPLGEIQALLTDSKERRAVNACIQQNREYLVPYTDLPTLYPKTLLEEWAKAFSPKRPLRSLEDFAGKDAPMPCNIYLEATDALREAGLLGGKEMRHEASLAPIALLRDWKVDVTVKSHRNTYTLAGMARAYGRGLSIAQARISLSMEILERASSYVSVDDDRVFDRKTPLALVRKSVAELAGTAFVEPNSLSGSSVKRDCVFTWLAAQTPMGTNVLVPAQAVVLFPNFDEPDLFASPSSTGLASGATLAQAKLAALLEIVERDAEASMPSSWEKCFRLRAANPHLQALFDAYQDQGICVYVQEKTQEFGIPVFQAFVRMRDGRIVGAHACKLSAQNAVLAAITEVAWPFSPSTRAANPTAPYEKDVPVRLFEELPTVHPTSFAQALAFVEDRLACFGLCPLYVDLSREDMPFPVVRAIIPGLDVACDHDPLATPSKRLLARLCHGLGGA